MAPSRAGPTPHPGLDQLTPCGPTPSAPEHLQADLREGPNRGGSTRSGGACSLMSSQRPQRQSAHCRQSGLFKTMPAPALGGELVIRACCAPDASEQKCRCREKAADPESNVPAVGKFARLPPTSASIDHLLEASAPRDAKALATLAYCTTASSTIAGFSANAGSRLACPHLQHLQANDRR